jgi:maleate cis-trans isomerase
MTAHINYGTRLNIGMLLPSPNAVAEQQMAAMCPDGVALQTTRLLLPIGTRENLLAMIEQTEQAAELVAGASVDLIAFHCTGATTLGPNVMDDIKSRIENTTNCTATTTAHAAKQALEAVGAKRIVFVCPNRKATLQQEVAFFREQGFDVIKDGCLDIHDPAQLRLVEPSSFRDLILAHRDSAADAYFIGCTAVRSVEAVEELEAELKRPVLTSNQVMVWHALRLSSIPDKVEGFGSLLRLH